MSQTEPEMGLGTVKELEGRRVTLEFPAVEETRTYVAASAPLQRAVFQEGEQIETEDGQRITVERVKEENGLFTYFEGDVAIPEGEISARSSGGGLLGRLYSTIMFDDPADFDLRFQTLKLDAEYRKLPVKGLIGGRVELIPHQQFIAREVVSRRVPRVLLADEAGLGKTIEAGLILHRLLLSGRASRVIVVVPESLAHQWFVELLRRFNLAFTLVDQSYCEAVEVHDAEGNPFTGIQFALTTIEFLTGDEKRLEQASQGKWDILVVDEAHHLAWAPEEASPEYSAIELLARKTPGLLLLTATPRQVGETGHFARLRLLDPFRHSDFERHLEENKHLPEVAKAAAKLAGGKNLTDAEWKAFGGQVKRVNLEDPKAKARLIQELIDRHGIGRVMFRNVRAALEGNFPERILKPAPLELYYDEARAAMHEEFMSDVAFGKAPEYDYFDDPRGGWLLQLIEELGNEKILLISSSREKAEAIAAALSANEIATGVFHEGLEMIERDREAARFAEEKGCQILVCSEIGSEGRNFQFAQHLALWDLPLNPAVLEQRIGRLDRIGQPGNVHIHVPFAAGTGQEVLFRWLHEGIDAFEAPSEGGDLFVEKFAARVRDLGKQVGSGDAKKWEKEVKALIKETSKYCDEVNAMLDEGRDYLLELASCRPKMAKQICDGIANVDADSRLEEYMLDLVEALGWDVERIEDGAYVLDPEGQETAALPGLSFDGCSITFRRSRAQEREDWQFITWDHPAVREAMEHIVRGERGTISIGNTKVLNTGTKWVVECIYVLEPQAPPSLNADRFLPPTPIRVVIGDDGKNRTKEYPTDVLAGDVWPKKKRPELPEGLPDSIKTSGDLADAHSQKLIEMALKRVEKLYSAEIGRLKQLIERNPLVDKSELDVVMNEGRQVVSAIRVAQPRLDSVRVVLSLV